ncbi:ESPN [Cordylochernes scorpioides]|uniref:ESPN n=1 Tax=Cordylochernes scorpioides TaxID=51811 RepID=A0ABY6KLL4_9ARAC|nr:ESPN [Cordylochernes scorpioides]
MDDKAGFTLRIKIFYATLWKVTISTRLTSSFHSEPPFSELTWCVQDSDDCSCQSTGSEESLSCTDEYPSDTTGSSLRSSRHAAPFTVLSGWNFYSSQYARGGGHSNPHHHHHHHHHRNHHHHGSAGHRTSSSDGSYKTEQEGSSDSTIQQEPFYLHQPNMTSDDRVKKLFGKKQSETNNNNKAPPHTHVVTAEVHHNSDDGMSVSDASDPAPDYDDARNEENSRNNGTNNNTYITPACSSEACSLSTDEGIYHEADEMEDESYNQFPSALKELIDVLGSSSTQSSDDTDDERAKSKAVAPPPPPPPQNDKKQDNVVPKKAMTQLKSIFETPAPKATSEEVPPPPPPPKAPLVESKSSAVEDAKPPPKEASTELTQNNPTVTRLVSSKTIAEDDEEDSAANKEPAEHPHFKKATKKVSHPINLPFIPPQFNSPPDSDVNIKPSEYLRKVTTKFSAPATLSKSCMDLSRAVSKENLYDPQINTVRSESIDDILSVVHQATQPEPKATKPPVEATVSNPTGLKHFSVTVEQLQTIQLKKTEKANPEDRNVVLLQKNNLIAELKQSKDISGIKKLKEEKSKLEVEMEKQQAVDLAQQFKAENFVDKVPDVDANGCAIPLWKRQVLAKKAAEKAKKEAEELRQV